MLSQNDKIVLFFCEMATALDSFLVQPRKRQYPGENSNCPRLLWLIDSVGRDITDCTTNLRAQHSSSPAQFFVDTLLFEEYKSITVKQALVARAHRSGVPLIDSSDHLLIPPDWASISSGPSQES
jgi:hypothetical protein